MRPWILCFAIQVGKNPISAKFGIHRYLQMPYNLLYNLDKFGETMKIHSILTKARLQTFYVIRLNGLSADLFIVGKFRVKTIKRSRLTITCTAEISGITQVI